MTLSNTKGYRFEFVNHLFYVKDVFWGVLRDANAHETFRGTRKIEHETRACISEVTPN